MSGITKLLYAVYRKHHEGLGLIFSLSYCHTVWSTTVLHHVVHLSVTLCIVTVRVSIYRAKVVPACSYSRQVSICLFRTDTFATKRTGKKQVEENANVSYFETLKTMRALV